MSETAVSDYSDEDDMTLSDNEEILNDCVDDTFGDGTKKYMPDLLPSAELSEKVLEKTTSQFSEVFNKRYPSSGLQFFKGSLVDALNQSIFNFADRRPLILYIRHGESLVDNIFCEKFFQSKKIVDILNKEFIIWPWDRTDMKYYRQFLKLLIDKLGSEVASQIDSYSYLEMPYPLLVCLSQTNDRYFILDPIIDNRVQEEEMMYSILCAIRDDFDQDINPNEGEIKEWYMPNSHVTSISPSSDQFIRILRCLNIEERKITSIDKIVNILWSVQYSSKKRRYEDRHGHSPNERELFYGCPLSMARDILRNGFLLNTNCIHGNKHGHGFYFSSERNFCEKYQSSDETKHDKKAIIICQILIDESNTTGDNSNICVLRRNEQILPEYLVIYTE